VARNLGLRPVIVGMTVVGMATSFPELAVCLVAALELAGTQQETVDQALANIVGSNVANILLILGVASALRPLALRQELMRLELLLLVLASLALALVVWFHPTGIDRVVGIVFLGGMVVVLVCNVLRARERRVAGQYSIPGGSTALALVKALVGGLLVSAGAAAMVRSASNLAVLLGVSQGAVGITILAVGTSLPELVASVAAIRKDQVEISVGNIVGSNLFNILLIGGTVGVVRPLPSTPELQHYGIPCMLGATLLLLMLGSRGRLVGRSTGLLMLVLFAAFVAGVRLLGGGLGSGPA
jgi:cation:H+ antiporter